MYTVLDIFSGAGGFSIGFEQAGFHSVAAVEFDKHAAHTYAQNHPHAHVFNEDICKLDIREVENIVGRPDVVIGGFPCQGFSVAGKRDPLDPRNRLPLEAIRYVRHFQPKLFVMENVKGLLSMEKGETLKFFVEEFERAGYRVRYQLLKAVEYRVPQLRERLIIVGIRNDLSGTYEFPLAVKPEMTLYEAIHDIETPGSYEETGQHNHEFYTEVDKYLHESLGEGKFLCDVRHGEEHVHSWEIGLKGECSQREELILNAISENRRRKEFGPKDGNPLSEETICRLSGLEDIRDELTHLIEMEYLEECGDKYDIHDRKVSSGLRRFSRFKPLNTITTMSGVKSPYAHYSHARNFTVRELARVQTFPDDFVFHGPILAQYRQVGNAVPPAMAKAVAEEASRLLKEIEATLQTVNI